MTAQRPRWVVWLFGPLVDVVAFFYRHYTTNRRRVAEFLARPGVASLFRKLVVITFVAWIVVWLTASDVYRDRFTDWVRGGFGMSAETPQ